MFSRSDVKLHEAAQIIVMVVREMTVKKSCKYGEYGSFEHMVFLLSCGYDLIGEGGERSRIFRSRCGRFTTRLPKPPAEIPTPRAGITEAEDRQATTVFTVPTVIPPSAHDKTSIMKRYHLRRTCSHPSPCRFPTMVTLHDVRFVEWRLWNDGWIVIT